MWMISVGILNQKNSKRYGPFKVPLSETTTKFKIDVEQIKINAVFNSPIVDLTEKLQSKFM